MIVFILSISAVAIIIAFVAYLLATDKPLSRCKHKNAKGCWLAQQVFYVKCPNCGREGTFRSPDKFFNNNENGEGFKK